LNWQLTNFSPNEYELFTSNITEKNGLPIHSVEISGTGLYDATGKAAPLKISAWGQQLYIITRGSQTLSARVYVGTKYVNITNVVNVSPSAPIVSHITGPTKVGAGSEITMTGVLSRSGPYTQTEWQIIPLTGITLHNGLKGSTLDATWNQMGTYTINFVARDSQTGLGSYKTKYLTVDDGGVIIMSLISPNIFKIEIQDTEIINYDVFNQSTGVLVEKGNLNIEYQYLDLSRLKKGIYVVNFKDKGAVKVNVK